MLISTTSTLDGKPIQQYLGIVNAQAIIGANVFKDFLGGLRDFFGGRSKTYEKVLEQAKEEALREMAEKAQLIGANAIVGVDLDYETIGANGSMLMVIATGTAVVI